MKAQTHSIQWKAVSLGVLGLIVGYSVVIAQQGKIAFAEKVQCPMKNHAVCTSGVCSADCPLNCQHNPPV